MIAKRIIDITGSLVGLIVLLPLIAIVALAIFLTMGFPVLFRQTRPGLHCQPFVIYKFRTMSDATDESGKLLTDGQRLTRLGQFLRSASLDELPQLWNVLTGAMSFVGPRPLLVKYIERYTTEQMRRHEMKPGITGWVQVCGRNGLSWDEKFKLDVWYVDNWSLWLDIRILFLTVLKVFKREGISAQGNVTMPEFMGLTKNQDSVNISLRS